MLGIVQYFKIIFSSSLYSEHKSYQTVSFLLVKFQSGLWKKSTHRTSRLMKNSNFIYINRLQSGKTWCGLVKCKNLPNRSSCEKYKLWRRLFVYYWFHWLRSVKLIWYPIIRPCVNNSCYCISFEATYHGDFIMAHVCWLCSVVVQLQF